MKVNIVGINFTNYGMLNKIEQYFSDNNIECKYIEYFRKSALDIESIFDCDGIIYVEIEPIKEDIVHFSISTGMDGRTIAAAFRKFLPQLQEVKKEISEEPVVENIKTESSIKIGKLSGFKIDIGDKTVTVNKEDFEKFLELKRLTNDLGYRIVEAIVNEQ